MSSTKPNLLILLAGAGLVLGACAGNGVGVTDKGAVAVNPLEQYKASVAEAPEQVQLAVHAEGISDKQRAALEEFAARWRDAGGGDIVVRMPTRPSGDDTDALRATANAVEFLEFKGVPSTQIRQQRYEASDPKAPIVAVFSRYEVTTPDCSRHWDNLTATNANGPSKHLGCAVTSNLAVMVADPRELNAPAARAASDNSRRAVILGKYRDGKTTSSDKDDQASGTVSTVKQ
jgi:pilus assembly protein CpaD